MSKSLENARNRHYEEQCDDSSEDGYGSRYDAHLPNDDETRKQLALENFRNHLVAHQMKIKKNQREKSVDNLKSAGYLPMINPIQEALAKPSETNRRLNPISIESSNTRPAWSTTYKSITMHETQLSEESDSDWEHWGEEFEQEIDKLIDSEDAASTHTRHGSYDSYFDKELSEDIDTSEDEQLAKYVGLSIYDNEVILESEDSGFDKEEEEDKKIREFIEEMNEIERKHKNENRGKHSMKTDNAINRINMDITDIQRNIQENEEDLKSLESNREALLAQLRVCETRIEEVAETKEELVEELEEKKAEHEKHIHEMDKLRQMQQIKKNEEDTIEELILELDDFSMAVITLLKSGKYYDINDLFSKTMHDMGNIYLTEGIKGEIIKLAKMQKKTELINVFEFDNNEYLAPLNDSGLPNLYDSYIVDSYQIIADN